MNKYQESLKIVEKSCISVAMEFNLGILFKEDEKALETLQELVDKETPKKFKIKTDKDGRTIWVCPNCSDVLMKFWSEVETIRPFNYCDECGQRLDWSDEVCRQK